MRKIKVNVDQIYDVIACHLESLGTIRTDEHVSLTPLQLKDGMITVYVAKNKGEMKDG